MKQTRNEFIDFMRGIAMLLVVLGHTMTGCTIGAEESFLFNIVWSLQMPMFILISGYVSRYSRGISDISDLIKFVKRRTIAYLLPWFVWSFIVRGIILGENNFLNIEWLLWHMDSGYWFLSTIWIISMIFGVSIFVAKKLAQNSDTKQQLITLILYVAGMVLLAGVGLVAGFSFLAIKLTLYYMPFYFAGYLYGKYRDKIFEKKWGKKTVDVVVAICLVVWLFIMKRFSLYALPDSGMAILLRAGASVTGCVAVCGLCKGSFNNNVQSTLWRGLLRWCGVHSLEIYLTHSLLLSLLKMAETPLAASLQGTTLMISNYILTVVLTLFVVKLINSHKLLNLVLYGNKG